MAAPERLRNLPCFKAVLVIGGSIKLFIGVENNLGPGNISPGFFLGMAGFLGTLVRLRTYGTSHFCGQHRYWFFFWPQSSG
jgi:hypothetical protein